MGVLGVFRSLTENLAAWLFCTSGRKLCSEYWSNENSRGRGLLMKRLITIGCSLVLALILMDTYQVVKAPTGLTVVKAGQAFAADMGPPPPPPPPVAAPIGKGKAPIGKGKGKAPPPPVITKG